MVLTAVGQLFGAEPIELSDIGNVVRAVKYASAVIGSADQAGTCGPCGRSAADIAESAGVSPQQVATVLAWLRIEGFVGVERTSSGAALVGAHPPSQ
jgi:hypothetical protein